MAMITVDIKGLEDISALYQIKNAIHERAEVASWHSGMYYSSFDYFFYNTPNEYQATNASYIVNIAKSVDYLLDYYADMETYRTTGSYSNFPKTLRQRYEFDDEHQFGKFIMSENETYSQDSMDKYKALLSCCVFWLNQMNCVYTNRCGCTQEWPYNGNYVGWEDEEDYSSMLCVRYGNYNKYCAFDYQSYLNVRRAAPWHGQTYDIQTYGYRRFSGYTGMYVDNRCGFDCVCKLYLTFPMSGDWSGDWLGNYIRYDNVPQPLISTYVLQAPKWQNVKFECMMTYDNYRDSPDEWYYSGNTKIEQSVYGLDFSNGTEVPKQFEMKSSDMKFNISGTYEGWSNQATYKDNRYNWNLDFSQDYTIQEEETLSTWEGRDGYRNSSARSTIDLTANIWFGFGFWNSVNTPVEVSLPANTKKLVTPQWRSIPSEPMNPNWRQYNSLSEYARRDDYYWEESYTFNYRLQVAPILDFTNSFTQITIDI